ncbi:uncharacterized protein PADG_12432 [Paracoccidioides brasiliensis Pb18]|uniref:Uncharacterized protein n=1 Tax=Paracoccidioides brasiliensis (strain Pb18) TaxID=502780 RepID=A0A0A0HS34_PARBD|nr:uncharacterized protein PADG_12432 [Paracoccidioides brasiliensis Pb18]KGM91477.1 hypothetical protein PADG_12432 [Paracoccidioides brasiliensis Pb18]
MAAALLASSVAVWGAPSVAAEVNSMAEKGKRRFAVGLAWLTVGLGSESRQVPLSDADADVVADAYVDVGRGADSIAIVIILVTARSQTITQLVDDFTSRGVPQASWDFC